MFHVNPQILFSLKKKIMKKYSRLSSGAVVTGASLQWFIIHVVYGMLSFDMLNRMKIFYTVF